MILTAADMKALEQRAFADGVSAEALMEEAGEKIAFAVRQFFPQAGKCLVHFGKGHNGGDALVAARHLAAAGWEIQLVPAFPESRWAEMTAKKMREFADGPRTRGSVSHAPLIVLDGLLGIGASGVLRGEVLKAAKAINRLRSSTAARVVSIDLPTGLGADSGAADDDAVVADFTVTIGCAKTGLLADGAAHFVGRLAVLPLAGLSARLEDGGDTVATAAELTVLLPRRSFDTHKGQCGRVGIVAGSAGLSGAAALCAGAALHAGAGLVTLYVPAEIYPIATAQAPSEVMMRAVESYAEVIEGRHDVLGIGPGLGRKRDAEIIELIVRFPGPAVIDADALNALATQLHLLETVAGPRLLTPHPGEMERLFPGASSKARAQVVREFTAAYPVTLLLKGARTVIGAATHPLSYNTTGSPGMATGGMGDVLTGVCAALLGQGLNACDSARVGAWICGRAAELALTAGASEESLAASDVIAHLGGAFHALHSRGW